MDSSARKSIRVKLEQKDIMNVPATTGTGVSPTNSLVVSDRVQGIIAPPERTLTIRNLLIPGTTHLTVLNSFRKRGLPIMLQLWRKVPWRPKSDIRFDLKSAPVRTIAHYFKASRRDLDDAPRSGQLYQWPRSVWSSFQRRAATAERRWHRCEYPRYFLPQATEFAPALTLSNPRRSTVFAWLFCQAVLAGISGVWFCPEPD